MKALTNINARSLADAVAVASAAAARGQAFAFSGGGTDLIQQIKDGTNQADVLINLRTVRGNVLISPDQKHRAYVEVEATALYPQRPPGYTGPLCVNNSRTVSPLYNASESLECSCWEIVCSLHRP